MKNKYKILIISCWVVLGVCFIIKLFGGNWFEYSSSNEHFIKFCNFFESGIPFYILSTVFYIITINIYYMAVLKLRKPNLILIVVALLTNIIKIFLLKYQIISFILELCILYFVPIIFKRTKRMFLISFLGLLLFVGFQMTSLVIRNLGFNIINNTFISLLYSIDYVIMLILYYLYSIRKEGN